MKTLPDQPKPIPSGPWRPGPGDYFFWSHQSSTVLYLCKWWDKNGIASIVVKEFTGLPCNEGMVVYFKNHPYMAFTKPSEKFMEEFVPEFKEVDYAEFFHGAEADIKETFSGFMSKITTVT